MRDQKYTCIKKKSDETKTEKKQEKLEKKRNNKK